MSKQKLNLEQVKSELKHIIIDSLELDKTLEEIDGDDLINELGINSVDALEILVRVESQYDIMIPDEDLNASLISTLDGFANYIMTRCKYDK